ncbi:MAG: cytochrome C biogenesis protein [Alphaproteobacteria bacterium RIFCSPHIGHO2_12_FULL_66_14]|jgi:cytochrome c biogenesis protein CcdA|nr:MAG: cytochrome C biogenesis protein [Alphaproteobacteria bacterium RIFCSPHIGHO2_12_FULL_66_14]
MDFSLATYGLGFVAGMLSTLSPCVLPLIPLVVGQAVAAHPMGVFALAGGLAASFTLVGLLVAVFGHLVGLDSEALRSAGAVLMGGLGVVLLSQRLQDRFALAAGHFGNAGDGWMRRVNPQGWEGQVLVGALLGTVWSPCVGPTLGAASLAASQQQHLAEVGLTMAMFGLGAALPLAVLGSIGRSAMGRWRLRLANSARLGKTLLGAAMIVIAVSIASGIDKKIETWLVEISPAWLTDFTTKY